MVFELVWILAKNPTCNPVFHPRDDGSCRIEIDLPSSALEPCRSAFRSSYDIAYPLISLNGVHTKGVNGLLELNDGTILSCSDDTTIKRWAVGGQYLRSYLGHSSAVYCLMEVDDNTFLSGSGDKTMKVWSKTTGDCLHTIETASSVRSLLRLNNNTSFLCELMDGIAEIRMGTYETLNMFRGLQSPLCELSNGFVVVLRSSSSQLEVWDMKTKTNLCIMRGQYSRPSKVIELREKLTIATTDNQKVRIWDVTSGCCLQELKEDFYVNGLVELSDGTLLCAYKNWIKVYSKEGTKWERVGRCELKAAVIRMIATKDGSVVTGSSAGQIEVRKTWTR